VPPSRRKRAEMAAVRNRETGPELAVRSALHRAGFRFRLHDRRLPGSPDIVLPKIESPSS
jgi:DNA mismatch endonuclease, patch repair protein